MARSCWIGSPWRRSSRSSPRLWDDRHAYALQGLHIVGLIAAGMALLSFNPDSEVFAGQLSRHTLDLCVGDQRIVALARIVGALRRSTANAVER